MSFYNPYSSKPDIGQGIADLIPQLIQMMMFKKYMSGDKATETEQLGTTQMPPPNIGGGIGNQIHPSIQGMLPQPGMPQGMGQGMQMPQMGAPPSPGGAPNPMMMIMQLLQQMQQRGR